MAEAKERPVAVVVNPEPDPQESRPAKIAGAAISPAAPPPALRPATRIVKAKKPMRRR
jgi:hypothetical protein